MNEIKNNCNNNFSQPLVKIDTNQNDWIHSVPMDVIYHIFSYLTLRDLSQVNKTCRLWREISKEPGLWNNFLPLYKDTGVNSRESVISRIERMLNSFRVSESTASGLDDGVKLGKLGIIPLQRCLEYARKIKITDFDMNRSFEDSLYSRTFYDKCESLGLQYLSMGNIENAQEIVDNMIPPRRRNLAFAILKHHLENNDFDKAFNALKHNSHIFFGERHLAPCLFMHAAICSKNIELGFKTLDQFKTNAMFPTCLIEFDSFLLQNHEIELSNKLKTLYPPETYSENKNTTTKQMRYYINTNQIEKAMNLALSRKNTGEKIDELQRIDNGLRDYKSIFADAKFEEVFKEISVLKNSLTQTEQSKERAIERVNPIVDNYIKKSLKKT